MKKLLVYLTVFVGMASFAQTGPKIEFKEETINYGEVEKGKDDGIRIFEFTNTGDAPLLIKNAKSTCGCTVPEWSKEPIAPGGKGKIKVQYNMNPGPISKTITIESNAVNKPNGMIPLRIKGTVIVKEEVSPLIKKKTFPNS
ncbi:DUF1573 domain-containing protein [Flavobacterium cucumis]|uniref:DUF1573 domain-containing protein n=1 Tax=Flavobacterium cucumis TaxID=416016 RepID=A0A1M7ZXX2_9FLAO|nr:DUF1573 domain-containing protein [Flavobacterium cucumis]SHO73739.1 Protein of unknown function [Flavobacterium cucumis]